VVKEDEDHLRGRPPGQVPEILRAALLAAGVSHEAVCMRTSELAAVQLALETAQPGDVVALLVHSPKARAEVLSLLGSTEHARP
jgi:cyanophycin synthetase